MNSKSSKLYLLINVDRKFSVVPFIVSHRWIEIYITMKKSMSVWLIDHSYLIGWMEINHLTKLEDLDPIESTLKDHQIYLQLLSAEKNTDPHYRLFIDRRCEDNLIDGLEYYAAGIIRSDNMTDGQPNKSGKDYLVSFIDPWGIAHDEWRSVDDIRIIESYEAYYMMLKNSIEGR